MYSLRPELLVTDMDVSRCILVLDTSISVTSNLERREYKVNAHNKNDRVCGKSSSAAGENSFLCVGKRVSTISNESKAHKQGKSNILAITTEYSESCGRSSNWTSKQILYHNTNGMIN